jgi:hypothetical protein
MKQQDIDRLREICEKEGFIIANEDYSGTTCFHITKKDHWEGVEFVECVKADLKGNLFDNLIYPIAEIRTDTIRLKNGIGSWKHFFKPSTEAAYVEQLIGKAEQLYGEIKDGDEFEHFSGTVYPIHLSDEHDFDYCKEADTLSLWGFPLYKQGKWAKKIERVRVEWKDWHKLGIESKTILQEFELKNIDWNKVENKDDIGDYLAKCLEDKLNEK